MAAKGNKAAQELWAKREEIVNKHWDEFKSDADMSEAQISAEIIAEAYEKWLYSGQKAEDAATQKLFTAIRDFFRDIYRSIKAIGGVEVTDEVDAFFREISGLDTDNEVQTLAQAAGNKQAVDLTSEFGNIKGLTKENARELINTKLNELINKPLKTGTPPLRIQVTAGNKAHIRNSNAPLKGGKRRRHQAVLSVLEKIVSNAEKTDRPGEVDLTHNTRRKTLKHKAKVKEYVYFEAPIQINVTDTNGNIETAVFTVELATERVKGQDKNLLDLYNVRTKKRSPHTPLGVTAGNNNNITEKEGVVNSKNTLHQKGVNVNFDEIKESQEYKKLKEQIDSDRKITAKFDGHDYGVIDFLKHFAPDNADKEIKRAYEKQRDYYLDEQYEKLRGNDIKAKKEILEANNYDIKDLLEEYNDENGSNLTEEEFLALDLSEHSDDISSYEALYGEDKYRDIKWSYEDFMTKQYMDVMKERISDIEDYIIAVLPKYGYKYLYTDESRISESTYIYFKPIKGEEEEIYNIRLANHFDRHPSEERLSIDITENADKIAKNIDTYLKDPTDDEARRKIYYQRGYHGTPYEFDELATEQVKGQDKNLLDLYNVHIKRNPAGMHLSTFPQGFNKDSITDKNGKIKALYGIYTYWTFEQIAPKPLRYNLLGSSNEGFDGVFGYYTRLNTPSVYDLLPLYRKNFPDLYL